MGLSSDPSSPRGSSNPSPLLRGLQEFIGRLTPGQRNLLLALCALFVGGQVFQLVRTYLRTHDWLAVVSGLPGAIIWSAVAAVPAYYLLAWRGVEEFAVAASRANVPVPSKRERISPELEAELAKRKSS